MVFLADFSGVVLTSNISPILVRIKSLSFVLDCSEKQILPVIGKLDDPIRIKPLPPQQSRIEGTVYGNYMGIKEVFHDIITSTGVENVSVSIRESAALTKFTRLSALVTASIVFTIIFLTQLDINYGSLVNGELLILTPILLGSIIGFFSSFTIELLILIKERMRQ